MDDLQDKISQIMSDPEALAQVQSLGKMLGLGGEQSPPAPPEPAQDDLGIDAGKLMALAPMLGNLRQEDDTTRLLSALRPFLSSEKCRKLDSAGKMIRLIRLIPALKNAGLFNDFF